MIEVKAKDIFRYVGNGVDLILFFYTSYNDEYFHTKAIILSLEVEFPGLMGVKVDWNDFNSTYDIPAAFTQYTKVYLHSSSTNGVFIRGFVNSSYFGHLKNYYLQCKNITAENKLNILTLKSLKLTNSELIINENKVESVDEKIIKTCLDSIKPEIKKIKYPIYRFSKKYNPLKGKYFCN